MNAHPSARGGFRTLALIIGCVAIGAVAGPGVSSAANDAFKEVFVTNTASNPVPVAPQGTTQVAGTVAVAGTTQVEGTVTVANQPEPPAAPEPIQVRFGGAPLTHDLPIASETAYEVPEGKLLTVEYGQIYFARFGAAELREASLTVGCVASGDVGSIDRITVNLPEQPNGDNYVVTGGPLKILVPGGSCLRYRGGARDGTIREGLTIFLNGSFTGYLTDMPGS